MYSKIRILPFVIAVLLMAVLSACKTSEPDPNTPVVPGGTDVTSSDSSSVTSDSTVTSSVTSVSAESTVQDSTSSAPEPHLHAYKITVVNPTCTESGYTLYKCSCGDSRIEKVVSKKEHSWGEWETVKSATTLLDGEKKRVCTVCGKAETAVINMLIPNYEEMKTKLLELINAKRQESGLNPLTVDNELSECAKVRAEEITENYGHTRQNGEDLSALLKNTNVIFDESVTPNENISNGETAEEVLDYQLSDSSYYDNINSSLYNKTAIGITRKDGKFYWVQIFIAQP